MNLPFFSFIRHRFISLGRLPTFVAFALFGSKSFCWQGRSLFVSYQIPSSLCGSDDLPFDILTTARRDISASGIDTLTARGLLETTLGFLPPPIPSLNGAVFFFHPLSCYLSLVTCISAWIIRLTFPPLFSGVGLFFKLHGTHRPNSMKKTVIKRRKRVPAASGAAATGRMSDQAAAEALVAVGRAGGVGGGNGNGTATGEESDGETEQPKRKRAKRGGAGGGKTTRASAAAASSREDDDMGEESEPSVRERKRPAVNGWGPDAAARSASPSHRASSRTQDYAAHLSRGAPPHAFTGGSPHPFELPPLAALSNGAAAAFLTARPDFAAATQSSYMRSGSNAPSRTHSPLNPGVAGGYILPPPHVLSGYYPGAPPPPGDLGNLMHFGLAAGLGMPPTLADLERHYIELGEHKKNWEEMMDRTDKMMAGVKRTIDEMKGLSLSSPPRQPSPLAASSTVNPGQASPSQVGRSLPDAGGASVPLARGSGSSNREDRRDSVWPVTEPASTRD